MKRRKIAFTRDLFAKQVFLTNEREGVMKAFAQNDGALGRCREAMERLVRGEITAEEYERLTAQLKQQAVCMLPFMTVRGNPDEAELMTPEARPSHLCGLDIERKDMGGLSAREFYDRYVRPREGDMMLVMAHESLRGGLHLYFLRLADTMEDCMAHYWRLIGQPEGCRYDPSFKDLRRRAVVTSEVLYVDWDLLFEEFDESDDEEWWQQLDTIDRDQRPVSGVSVSPAAMSGVASDDRLRAMSALTANDSQRTIDGHGSMSALRAAMSQTAVSDMTGDNGLRASDRQGAMTGGYRAIDGQGAMTGGMGKEMSPAAMVRGAMAKAGISASDLTTEGARHASLLKLLSLGLAKTMERDVLEAQLTAITPRYMREKDARQLLDDFYGRYYDDVPCQIESPFGGAGSSGSSGEAGISGSSGQSLRAMATRRLYHDDYDNPEVFRGAKAPEALRVALRSAPEGTAMAVAMSVLTGYGSFADQRLTAEDHAGNVMPPLLETVDVGNPASQKSAVTRLFAIIMREVRRQDEQVRNDHDNWLQLKRRGGQKQLPPEPSQFQREISMNASNAARLKLTKNAKGRLLFAFDDEAAVLLGNAEWQDATMYLTKSWLLETYSAERVSSEAVGGSVQACLAFVLMGQPRVVRALFGGRNISQGLTSRLCFAMMPMDDFAPLVPLRKISAEDERILEETSARILALPEKRYDLPKLRNAIYRWQEERRLEAKAKGDRVLDFVRKRVAVNAFRFGFVLHILRTLEGGRGESQTTVAQALYLADYMTDVTIALFGRDIAREMAPVADIQPIATARTATATANDVVLSRLPETFAKPDLKALKPKASDSTLRGLLKKWVDEGRIEKTGANYRKMPMVSGENPQDSGGEATDSEK